MRYTARHLNALQLAVLIPCYNESLTISKTVTDFRRSIPGATIYVYDNNSSDNTSALATDAGAIVRKRSANPPLRVGADQGNAVFFQFHGKSSWSRLLGQVGSFSSTSQR